MKGKRNPEIPIELGGKLRHLRFDINAMATFEELTGLNLMKPSVQRKLASDMTVTQFRAFLYACLVHEDEALTLKQVGGFITTENMEEIAGKINQAKEAAAPEVEEDEETAPLATKRSRAS